MADLVHLQGTVGNSAVANPGENRAVTMTRNLGLRQGNTQAKFQDAVERGNAYAVANQAGVTSQAGLSATTPVLTLANPLGSGVNGVLWYCSATFLVAFGAAAAVWLAAGTNVVAAAVTGTLATSRRNLKLGNGQGNRIAALLAATLPAAPVAIAQLGVGLTGDVDTRPARKVLERWFNGAILIPPGANISIQTSTASGSTGMLCEFIWEEVPLPS